MKVGTYSCGRLGLGAMRLLSSNLVRDGRSYECWGPPADPEASREVMRAAVSEFGIHYIDLARGYGTGPGAAESLFREWMSPYPSDLLWSTKVGYNRDADGEWALNLSPEAIDRDVRASVAELGGPVPLFYLVANSTTDVTVRNRPARLADSFAPLREAQARGDILNLGVANVTAAELAELPPVAAVQNKLTVASLADPAQREVLDLCRRQDIPFVAWGIFQSDGFEAWEPDAKLKAAAAELNVTLQEASIALLLQAAPNLVVLTGASRRKSLESSVKAAQLSIPPDMLQRYGWA